MCWASRKRARSGSSALELGLHVVEGVVHLVAKQERDGQDQGGQRRHDQTVLDRRRALLIAQERSNATVHVITYIEPHRVFLKLAHSVGPYGVVGSRASTCLPAGA